jgi:hypothetical protein
MIIHIFLIRRVVKVFLKKINDVIYLRMDVVCMRWFLSSFCNLSQKGRPIIVRPDLSIILDHMTN